MKILVAGATGYIASELIPFLLKSGHQIYALVRDKSKFKIKDPNVFVLEGDLLRPKSLLSIPEEIDAAYYLVHSMKDSFSQFPEKEAGSARNFVERLSKTKARQLVFLSGLSNETPLSRHLFSRRNVEDILSRGKVPLTVLRAGIIIGKGSASFAIIRDLVERLPVMVAPRWVDQMTQPIAIKDVIAYLSKVLDHPECIGKTFEIGGPEVLSYKDLLLRFAKLRHLKRWIITVPVLTPRLSSYWLCLITSTSFSLARALVESLKNKAVCKENSIQKIFPMKLLSFDQAVGEF